MKVLLVYAIGDAGEKSRLGPYRTAEFLAAMAAAGVDLAVVDVIGGPPAARENPAPRTLPIPQGIAHHVVAPGASPWRPLGRLAALCRRLAPDLIQTFGAAPALSQVWSTLADGRRAIVHAVSAGGPVGDGRDELIDPCARLRPALRSLPGMVARRASRHVSALIGSNRRDIGRHRELKFFPAARFSVVAGIPVAVRPDEPRGTDRPPWPRFGYFNPDHTKASWQFVRDALGMIGSPDFTLAVAPDPGAAVRGAQPIDAVAWLPLADPAVLVGTIDVLIVPYADDRFAEVTARALVAGRTVIASDDGLNAEMLDYGRRGILFANGRSSDLAGKMLDVILSWSTRAMAFDVAADVTAMTSPQHCAGVFVAAWKRASAMAAPGAAAPRASAGR